MKSATMFRRIPDGEPMLRQQQSGDAPAKAMVMELTKAVWADSKGNFRPIRNMPSTPIALTSTKPNGGSTAILTPGSTIRTGS